MRICLRNAFALACGAVVCTVLCAGAVFAQAPQLPKSKTTLNPEKVQEMDKLVEQAIAEGDTPGAVIAVVRRDGVVLMKAYGDRQQEPTVEKMTTDSIFDLASVTKVTATAISVHILADRGVLDIDKPVAAYLPEFGVNGKENTTIRQCLTHTTGLVPDNSLKDYTGSLEDIKANICKLPIKNVGDFVYSDLGMIAMGYIIKNLTGQTLDVFAKENIYKPLGMNDTGYNPPESKLDRIVPTERRTPDDKDFIRGKVHDPRAFAMQGVAGHAGNFSTAPDLAILGMMLLNHGTYVKPDGEKVQILSEKEFDLMSADQELRGINKFWNKVNVRSLGWDKRSTFSRNRSPLMSNSAIGHGGFTGTVFWVDPDNDVCFILLGSCLHPDGFHGSLYPLGGDLGTLVMEGLPQEEQERIQRLKPEKAEEPVEEKPAE